MINKRSVLGRLQVSFLHREYRGHPLKVGHPEP
jgi:hypothetical protein